jgi:hypothetical protein
MRDPKLDESKLPETDSVDHLNAGIARLRSRVHRLESKSARRVLASHDHPAESDQEAEEVLRDLPERTIDEASKLIRGLVSAAVEPLRLVGDMAIQLGDEVVVRNRPGRRTGRRRPTPADLMSDLPRDVSAGLVRVLHRSLEISGMVVEPVHESYLETAPLQRTSEERELSRARRAVARGERLAELRCQEEKADRKVAVNAEPQLGE